MNMETQSLISRLLIREYADILASEPCDANDERLEKWNEAVGDLMGVE